MRTTLLPGATLLAVVTAVPSFAADLPVKAPLLTPVPVYSWTGFYVGVNAGYAWNQDGGSLECTNPAGVSFGRGCGLIPSSSLNSSGGFGGGQIGYNWQIGQYLLGVETDFQGANIRGSTSTNGPWPFVGLPQLSPTSSLFTASQNIDWFGTARLRFGYAGFDRTLIYATGGLAYGQVQLQTAVIFPAVSYPASATDTKTGWTVGGGIEYAFTNNVSARVEGLYYDLGDTSIASGSVPLINHFTRGKDFETQGALARAGLNYKFY